MTRTLNDEAQALTVEVAYWGALTDSLTDQLMAKAGNVLPAQDVIAEAVRCGYLEPRARIGGWGASKKMTRKVLGRWAAAQMG